MMANTEAKLRAKAWEHRSRCYASWATVTSETCFGCDCKVGQPCERHLGSSRYTNELLLRIAIRLEETR